MIMTEIHSIFADSVAIEKVIATKVRVPFEMGIECNQCIAKKSGIRKRITQSVNK